MDLEQIIEGFDAHISTNLHIHVTKCFELYFDKIQTLVDNNMFSTFHTYLDKTLLANIECEDIKIQGFPYITACNLHIKFNFVFNIKKVANIKRLLLAYGYTNQQIDQMQIYEIALHISSTQKNMYGYVIYEPIHQFQFIPINNYNVINPHKFYYALFNTMIEDYTIKGVLNA